MKYLSLLLTGLVLLQDLAEPQSRIDSSDAKQTLVLHLQESGAGWTDVPPLQKKLESIGPGVIPVLFDVLVKDEFPTPDGKDTLALGEPRRYALASALELLPREPLHAVFDQVSRASATEEQRLAALRLLERFGDSKDFNRAARVAGIQHDQGTAPVELAYRKTMTKILQREPNSVAPYSKLLRQLNPRLFVSASGAIASLKNKAAFNTLSRALSRDDEMDAVLLLELRRLAGQLPIPPSSDELAPVRGCLDSRDSAVLILSSSILKQLHDTAAVPGMIEALKSDDSNVRFALRGALKQLTHVNLGDDVDAWSEWYQSQLSWFNRWADRNAMDVSSDSVITSSRAIQALSAQPVFDEQVASRLLPGLDRREPYLVALTCASLGQMGSWNSVSKLVDTLARPNPEVRSAAHEALVQITGFDYPPEAEVWRFKLKHLEMQ